MTSVKKIKKLNEMTFFIEDLGGGKAVIDSDIFTEWINNVVGSRLLQGKDLQMIQQGMLEIKEKNYVKYSQIKIVGNKTTLNIIKSIKDTLLQDNGLLAENNFFLEFLKNLSVENKNLVFEEDLLIKSDLKDLERIGIHYTPCRFIYGNAAIICLWNKDDSHLFVVGYNHKKPERQQTLLYQILTEEVSVDPLFKNPLFYSLEMSLSEAGNLLGYSIYRLSKLLEEGRIHYRGQKSSVKNLSYSKCKIPLQELYAYINEAEDLENKKEKLLLLEKYIIRTREGIVKKIKKGTKPHSLLMSVNSLSLKQVNQRLIKKIKELYIRLRDHKTPSSKQKKTYIKLAIPEIVNIVKCVEQEKKNDNYDPRELTRLDDFIDILSNKKEAPPQKKGVTVAIDIFRALPQEYRRKGGH